MKFSVIVVTCNRDPAILKECLDSVVSQSFRDFELIVVNDGPLYEKRNEIDQVVSSYKDIIYLVNKNNCGANYSRNVGALASKGQIISFLDDDDVWDKERLEIVSRFTDTSSGIFYSDFISFSKTKTKYHKRICPQDEIESIKRMLEYNYLGGFSNVSFAKELFMNSGMLDEQMESYQDQDLFIRLLKEKPRIVYYPKPLSRYRISDTSISLNSNKKLNGLLRFIEKYSEYYVSYKECLIRRLKNELIYSEKQGWKKNSSVIAGILKKHASPFKVFFVRVKGKIKRYISSVLRIFRR